MIRNSNQFRGVKYKINHLILINIKGLRAFMTDLKNIICNIFIVTNAM